MGWNALEYTQPDLSLWEKLPQQAFVYFVHSYYVEPNDLQVRAALVTHGTQIVTAAIARDNLLAVQFHPEKSGDNGLQILANFVNSIKSAKSQQLLSL
jgi:glutamine amidotransferase